MREVALSQIVFDAGTQVRSAINEDVVADYAERMGEGAEFPPVVLFHDGNKYYLADGFHRVMASKRLGLADIKATVTAGTKTDALWFALGANKTNGSRMTNVDKQHAVALALAAWPNLLHREIAEQVGCSDSLVAKIAKRTGVEPDMRGRGLAAKTKRDKVRELVESGTPSVEIRKALNVHTGVIAEVRRELGMSTIDKTRRGTQERRERMREMASQGYTSRQIAAELGLNEAGCRSTMRQEGIEVPADKATYQTQRHNSTRIIENIVMDAGNLTADANLIDFSSLDRAQIKQWVDALVEAKKSLESFIRRLTKEGSKNVEAA